VIRSGKLEVARIKKQSERLIGTTLAREDSSVSCRPPRAKAGSTVLRGTAADQT